MDAAAPLLRIRLRCFAAAREAAGKSSDAFELPAPASLGALLDEATHRYGPEFGAVLATARVWVNEDEPVDGLGTVLAESDEVAILPPVSGGSSRP